MGYRNIIIIDPGKRGGKPIRGMRITVYNILDYLASGMTQRKCRNNFLIMINK